MKRIHLFEFTDQPWYPDLFRRMQTDYLQAVATLGPGHEALVPVFVRAMRHAGTKEIVDLCSGGTGPWLRLQEQFARAGWSVSITLTDKYPHPEAIRKGSEPARTGITYLPEPVDATAVPPHLTGMRTLFEGFHHFKPEQARAILRDAVERRAAIGIVEATLKPPLGTALLPVMPLLTFVSYLLLTPFITPRSWARFFWTYLVPLVPLATCWDGVISLLRVYSLRELQKLTDSLCCTDYIWEAGQASTGAPLFAFTYLIGYPA